MAYLYYLIYPTQPYKRVIIIIYSYVAISFYRRGERSAKFPKVPQCLSLREKNSLRQYIVLQCG